MLCESLKKFKGTDIQLDFAAPCRLNIEVQRGPVLSVGLVGSGGELFVCFDKVVFELARSSERERFSGPLIEL